MRHLIAALTRVTASLEYYYHGTSSKLGKKILKNGFDANPKEKIWDQSKNQLESFRGTYLTRDVEVAGRGAGAATGKLKGDMWIFEVLLDTDIGFIDEDELPDITNYFDKDIEDQEEAIEHAVEEWFDWGYEDDEGLDLGEPSDEIKDELEGPLKEWAKSEMIENAKAIRDAKLKVIEVLKGRVPDMNVSNIKVTEPIGIDQITSVVQVTFDSDGKGVYEVVYGEPEGRHFLSDINMFNKDEIMRQKELYFSEG